jgi:hypothetical protein
MNTDNLLDFLSLSIVKAQRPRFKTFDPSKTFITFKTADGKVVELHPGPAQIVVDNLGPTRMSFRGTVPCTISLVGQGISVGYSVPPQAWYDDLDTDEDV